MLTKKNIFNLIQRNEGRIKGYGVRQIGVFGSFIKSSQKSKSDVDILVTFKTNKKTFDNYMELKFFLQKILGRRIDLVIKETLKPAIKPYIMKEVEYAGL